MQKWLMMALLLVMVAAVGAQDASRTAPPDASQFQLEPFADGFSRALFVTHAGDDSGRLFLVQQDGLIRVMDANGTPQPAPFLDVSNLISADALGSGYTERGLLGLAFHPNYSENGEFFINYTEANSHDSIVARYRVAADDPNRADPASAQELMRVAQPFGNHNGGHLAFGPDGYLYISLGDGGSAGDPMGNGQKKDTLLGTILRIDIDTEQGYAIPADNPFVNDPAGADEIWAYGLRNVWRFSFDSATGDMFMGDVGQNRWEEINHQPAGEGGQNYGWSVLEASHPYSGGAAPVDAVMPVAEYQHINGHCSVTGGYVYRGEAIPALQGAYLYGDFCSGQLWSMYRQADGTWASAPLMDTNYTVSSFGTDETGELYLVDYAQGVLYRFGPAA